MSPSAVPVHKRRVADGMRRFCSEVWGRGHTQLRVWELQEMDAEAAHHWARVLRPGAPPRRKSAEKAQVRTIERVDDVRAIAPFAAVRTPPPPDGRRASKSGAGKPLFTRFPRLGGRQGRECDRRSWDGDDGARADEEVAYARPPVFGPERVVLDPRIQAVHRQIMRDMLYAGFWFTLVCASDFVCLIARSRLYRRSLCLFWPCLLIGKTFMVYCHALRVLGVFSWILWILLIGLGLRTHIYHIIVTKWYQWHYTTSIQRLVSIHVGKTGHNGSATDIKSIKVMKGANNN